MKVALLKNQPTDSENLDEQFKSVALNSGNVVYWESIIRLFNPTIISFAETEKLKDFDACIVTDLCWIRENSNFGYIEKLVDKYNIPFIPMSIGLQNNSFNKNFQLGEQVTRMLRKMEQRATLGIRGEYSASILRKHGITNIQVIGCPSLYYWNNRNLKIENNIQPQNCICNFKSFGSTLGKYHIDILRFFEKYNMLFVEQTGKPLSSEHINNLFVFEKIKNWLDSHSMLEFHYKDWVNKIKENDFSIGMRFHGNIIALHQNIKALFITHDSRTQEMIDFFELPYIKLVDFDSAKSISYYYALADYTNFNNNYAKKFDSFIDFVKKNNLEISKSATPLQFTPQPSNLTTNNYPVTISLIGNDVLGDIFRIGRNTNKFDIVNSIVNISPLTLNSRPGGG